MVWGLGLSVEAEVVEGLMKALDFEPTVGATGT